MVADPTLLTSVSHAVVYLTQPLLPPSPSTVTPLQLEKLKKELTTRLCSRYESHWYPSDPSRASAFRSILSRQPPSTSSSPLPEILKDAARGVGLAESVWEGALASKGGWQIWIDPGRVEAREGEGDGKEWNDAPFFFNNLVATATAADNLRTIWVSPPSTRPSAALPIRAPPAPVTTTTTAAAPASFLLPSLPITTPSPASSTTSLPRSSSPTSSESSAVTSQYSTTSSSHAAIFSPSSHQEKLSSIAHTPSSTAVGKVDLSDKDDVTTDPNPFTRAFGSAYAQSIASTPLPPSNRSSSTIRAQSPSSGSTIQPHQKTPSVTAYDAGNVGVLGGGVKLGGGTPKGIHGQTPPTSPRKQRQQQRNASRPASGQYGMGGFQGKNIFGAGNGYSQQSLRG